MRLSYPPFARVSFMRLSEFIVVEVERIVDEWEQFARTITPDDNLDRPILRDHARSIVLAAARDMNTVQTAREQAAKAKGNGPEKPRVWTRPPPAMENCGTPSVLIWCR